MSISSVVAKKYFSCIILASQKAQSGPCIELLQKSSSSSYLFLNKIQNQNCLGNMVVQLLVLLPHSNKEFNWDHSGQISLFYFFFVVSLWVLWHPPKSKDRQLVALG